MTSHESARNDGDDLERLFDQVAAESASGASTSSVPCVPNGSIAAAMGSESDESWGMFDRLGGIVRQLHDSLRELGYDQSLREVCDQVNDSQSRLSYIAELTEQAANKVLNAVDQTLPVQESMHARATALSDDWATMLAGNMSVEQFRSLALQSREYIAESAEQADYTRARLMEIMLAQDFQDISGQVIQKVLAITQRLESELAQLLRDYAPKELAERLESAQSLDLKNGPSLPGQGMGQDQVDSLLAELGF